LSSGARRRDADSAESAAGSDSAESPSKRPTGKDAVKRGLRPVPVTCRFPGCGSTRYLHAHHVIHKPDGLTEHAAVPNIDLEEPQPVAA
jgi:hypothetical protein